MNNTLYNTTCNTSCPQATFMHLQYPGTNYSYNVCIDCPNGCQNCTNTTCNTCKQGFVPVKSKRMSNDSTNFMIFATLNVTCVPSSTTNGTNCPPGTYFNSTAMVCYTCNSGCAQCDTTGTCTKFCNATSNMTLLTYGNYSSTTYNASGNYSANNSAYGNYSNSTMPKLNISTCADCIGDPG